MLLKNECSLQTRLSGRTFGSENWSWTQQTLEQIKGWETTTVTRLFRSKRRKDETWVEYHKRTCKMTRKMWVQMSLPFLFEKIEESMWRSMEWVSDAKVNAVISQNSLEDKNKFITYILNKIKIKERSLTKRQPGNWDPQISQFTRVMKDLLFNYVETVMWHANGSTANLHREQSTKRQLARFKDSYTRGGRRLPIRSRKMTAS